LSASVNITAVPEPSTTALLAALAALGVIAAKRLSSSRLPPANLGTFPTDKIPCV
jgi:hypothetical protein